MNCASCGNTLERREHAQPITVLGVRCWPRSLCDGCARAHQWAGGSAEALARLNTGALDSAELGRVREATGRWGVPFGEVLERARPFVPEPFEPPDVPAADEDPWPSRLAYEPDFDLEEAPI